MSLNGSEWSRQVTRLIRLQSLSPWRQQPVKSIFAMNGWDPLSGKPIMPENASRICKTFRVTCGMYNASGEFAIKIGIPTTSGVSGGIMGAVPGKFRIRVFGPAFDEKGNSIAGLKLLEQLSKSYQLSMF